MSDDDYTQFWLAECTRCCEVAEGRCPKWCGCGSSGTRPLTPEECWMECSGDERCYYRCLASGRA